MSTSLETVTSVEIKPEHHFSRCGLAAAAAAGPMSRSVSRQRTEKTYNEKDTNRRLKTPDFLLDFGNHQFQGLLKLRTQTPTNPHSGKLHPQETL